MTRYDRSVWVLAASLSAVAGYVDALGFLELGGYFVSFMSGNSTRFSVGMAESVSASLVAAGLIGAFVLGVMAGSLSGRYAGRQRRPVVLALVAMLLACAAALSAIGFRSSAVAAMAAAMGAENAVFERDGEVSIGLTYMTGTLVKFGQRLTSALLGGDRFAWVPYLLLWLGLIAGALLGAAVYPSIGLNGLWAAAGASAMLAMVSAKNPSEQD